MWARTQELLGQRLPHEPRPSSDQHRGVAKELLNRATDLVHGDLTWRAEASLTQKLEGIIGVRWGHDLVHYVLLGLGGVELAVLAGFGRRKFRLHFVLDSLKHRTTKSACFLKKSQRFNVISVGEIDEQIGPKMKMVSSIVMPFHERTMFSKIVHGFKIMTIGFDLFSSQSLVNLI